MKNTYPQDELLIGSKDIEAQKKMRNIMAVQEKKTTKIKPSTENELSTNGEWRDWDTDNDFPATYWAKLVKCGLPQRILEDLCKIHYGHGLYFYDERVENNVIVRIPKIQKEVKAWMQKNLIPNQWGNVHIRDLYLWKMSPVEFTVDHTNKKIIKVKVHDAAMVRWGDKNAAGVIDRAYLSANWPFPKTGEYAELPVVDPLDPEASLEANKSKTNFIYPVILITPTQFYYPHVAWQSDDMLEWLLVSQLTPVFHQSLLNNLVVTPTVIYINDAFWPQRYADWDDVDAKEKIARKKATFASIEGSLSGAEKAGKFITSGYVYDDQGNEIKGIKIETVDQKLPDQAFLMSNAQADSEFHYTMGGDPSLSGHGMPGGKELSGSGSEKMRSLQNRQILASLDRVVSTQFLNFAARYMGWEGEFGYLDELPTTLDVNKDGITKESQENVS